MCFPPLLNLLYPISWQCKSGLVWDCSTMKKAILSIHVAIIALRVFRATELQQRHTTIVDSHKPGYFLEICAKQNDTQNNTRYNKKVCIYRIRKTCPLSGVSFFCFVACSSAVRKDWVFVKCFANNMYLWEPAHPFPRHF